MCFWFFCGASTSKVIWFLLEIGRPIWQVRRPYVPRGRPVMREQVVMSCGSFEQKRRLDSLLRRVSWLVLSFWTTGSVCFAIPLQAASCTNRIIENKNKKIVVWRMRGSCSTTSRARPSHKSALSASGRYAQRNCAQRNCWWWRHDDTKVLALCSVQWVKYDLLDWM